MLKLQGVRYISNGELCNISSDQVYDFTEAMHFAICRYLCETGKSATHLVLGRAEIAKWHGMVALFKAEGLAAETQQCEKAEFHGCVVLKSAEDSRLEAVELEGP